MTLTAVRRTELAVSTAPQDAAGAGGVPFDLVDQVDRAGLTVAVVRTALELDVFALVADGADGVAALARAAECDERATGVLVRALLSLGLLVRDGDRLACAPVSRAYLHAGAPGDFRPILLSWLRNRDLLTDVVRRGAAPTQDHTDGASGAVWRSYAAPDLARWPERVPMLIELARERGLVPPPGGRVLDLACGSGLDAVALLQLEPTATAVCVDRPEVLDVARRLAHTLGVRDRIVTVAADLRSDPLPAGAADVVMLGNVAQYLTDGELAAVLARIRTVLVPGGVLQVRAVVVDDGTPGYEPNWSSAVEMLLASPRVPHRTGADYRALLPGDRANAPSRREIPSLPGRPTRCASDHRLDLPAAVVRHSGVHPRSPGCFAYDRFRPCRRDRPDHPERDPQVRARGRRDHSAELSR